MSSMLGGSPARITSPRLTARRAFLASSARAVDALDDVYPDGRIVGDDHYDHNADPEELVNLARMDTHADLIAAMAQQLDAGWEPAQPVTC
jgi:hypothetical protein